MWIPVWNTETWPFFNQSIGWFGGDIFLGIPNILLSIIWMDSDDPTIMGVANRSIKYPAYIQSMRLHNSRILNPNHSSGSACPGVVGLLLVGSNQNSLPLLLPLFSYFAVVDFLWIIGDFSLHYVFHTIWSFGSLGPAKFRFWICLPNSVNITIWGYLPFQTDPFFHAVGLLLKL